VIQKDPNREEVATEIAFSGALPFEDYVEWRRGRILPLDPGQRDEVRARDDKPSAEHKQVFNVQVTGERLLVQVLKRIGQIEGERLDLIQVRARLRNINRQRNAGITPSNKEQFAARGGDTENLGQIRVLEGWKGGCKSLERSNVGVLGTKCPLIDLDRLTRVAVFGYTLSVVTFAEVLKTLAKDGHSAKELTI
jgi:hypothetical protein